MSGTILGEFTGSLTSGTFGVIIAGTAGTGSSDIGVKVGSTHTSPHNSASLFSVGSGVGTVSEVVKMKFTNEGRLGIGLSGSLSGALHIRNNSTNPSVVPAIMMEGISGSSFTDIRSKSNSGSIRIFASPNSQDPNFDSGGVSIFGNGSAFPGSVYIDTGKNNSSKVVFRIGNISEFRDTVEIDFNGLRTVYPNTWVAPQAAYEQELSTAAGLCEIDFTLSNNFYIALTENTTFQPSNPATLTPGQSGLITIMQDSTTPFTIGFDSYFKFPSGSDKTMSTGLDSISAIAYSIQGSAISGSAFVICNLLKELI